VGGLAHTIENRAEENTSKTRLLRKVKRVRDLGSIRIIGPGVFQRVRHGPYDVCGLGRISAVDGGAEGGGDSEMEQRPQ
jgi:hypothetical protein